MTIASVNQKKRYEGNGSTTVFPYDFKINEASHLEVIIADADDTQTTLVLDTDYSVSGAGESTGGNVTYPISGDPLPSGSSITINRKPPLTQLVDLINQGDFNADTLEAMIDLVTMQLLYVDEKQTRAPRASITSGDDGDDVMATIEDAAAAAAASAVAAAASASAASTAETGAGTAQTNAETAETNAETAETNAEAWSDLAEKWSSEDEDVVVADGKYSAFHWSEKAKGYAEGSADAVSVDTTDFDDILSSADDTVQKALDTLDDHSHPAQTAAETSVDASGFSGNLDTDDDDVQACMQKLNDLSVGSDITVLENTNADMTASGAMSMSTSVEVPSGKTYAAFASATMRINGASTTNTSLVCTGCQAVWCSSQTTGSESRFLGTSGGGTTSAVTTITATAATPTSNYNSGVSDPANRVVLTVLYW